MLSRKSTSQAASGGQFSYEASLFRSPLWTVRLSWPGGSGRFHTILERFCGPIPGLQDRCWVFSGKRCNLDIDCGYSVQAWPFSHRLHSNPGFHCFIVLDFRINPFKLSFQGRQVIEVMIQHFFIIAFNPFSSTYTLWFSFLIRFK